jgi:hypothetical protein
MFIKENEFFMVFRRKIAVYSENHLMHMNAMLFIFCGQNAELFSVAVGDTYSNNCTSESLL